MSMMRRSGIMILFLMMAFLMQGCSSSSLPSEFVRFATINPDQWTTSWHEEDHGCGSGGLGVGYSVPSHGWASTGGTAQVAAGFDDSKGGDCRIARLFRGSFHFDLSGYRSDDVVQAVLQFAHRQSVAGSTAMDFAPSSVSCAGSLQVATDSWLSTPGSSTHYDFGGGDDLVPTAAYYMLPYGDVSGVHDDTAHPRPIAVAHDAARGITQFAVDVSSQVHEWLSGGSENLGFTLVAWKEDTGAAENDACVSLYDSFELDLFRVGGGGIFPTETPIPTKTSKPILYPTPTLTTLPKPQPSPTATPVPRAAKLVVTPSTASAFCLNGQYPPITIKNGGNLALSWHVTSDHPITIHPNQGMVPPGQTQQVAVTGSVGAQTITLTFTGNGGKAGVTFTCQ